MLFHLFFVALLPGEAHAQSGINRIINGKISTAEGSLLQGATIALKNTNISTSSDNTGSFSITIPDNQVNPVLLVSSVGYSSKEISVTENNNITVELEKDINNLENVVVIGYGTRQKKDLTGSIASVSAAQIAQRPASSL